MPSRLDQVNPVTRLLLALAAAFPILITLDWVSASTMLVLELVVFTVLGVSPTWMLRRLVPIFVVAPIAALSMALYGRPGGQVYFDWWLITISEQSLMMALAVLIRIFALALAAIVMMGGVDPTQMADGLAQILHLPARFVLGTLAGIRMIGLFIDDWRTMRQARRARGLGDTGRVRRFATMAFALLVFAIRRGTKLATSMEARGFTTEAARSRTWARPSPLGWPDAVATIVTFVICATAIGMALWAGTLWIIWTEP